MAPDVFDEETLPPDLMRALVGMPTPARRAQTAVVSWGAAAETGLSHVQCEDAWGYRDGKVFVVADGMGGREGGAAAATTTVLTLLDQLTHDDVFADWPRAMARANDAVIQAGRREGHDRSGAAVVAVRCVGGRVTIAHVGDARIYRVRGSHVELLTVDHTVRGELAAAGVRPGALSITESKLGALTGFLGGPEQWRRFSVRNLDTRPGDRLVLCSDGVHGHVTLETLQAAGTDADCQAAAERLVRAAIEGGSRDDATAVVLHLGVGARQR